MWVLIKGVRKSRKLLNKMILISSGEREQIRYVRVPLIFGQSQILIHDHRSRVYILETNLVGIQSLLCRSFQPLQNDNPKT